MKYTIKNILVPVNFSAQSMNALDTAIDIGKRNDAIIHLLHVLDIHGSMAVPGMPVPSVSLANEIASSYENNLDNLAESLQRQHGVSFSAHTEPGWIPSTISNKASTLGCDIIVMGIDVPTGKNSYMADSMAFRVLKQSTCPVLTVPAGKRISRFRKILFSVRPVAGAVEKYPFAQTFIQKNRASVCVMGVLQKDEVNRLAHTHQMVKDIRYRLASDQVSCISGLQCSDSIAEKLLETGNKAVADLLVITATMKRNLKQLFYGNYVQHIINNPDMAVLCIKPQTADRFAAQASKTAEFSLS